MTKQVEKQHERFMSDIGFSSVEEFNNYLLDLFWELDSTRDAMFELYLHGEEQRKLINLPINTISHIQTLLHNAKEGYVYPFLLEPLVLWVLAPAISGVKTDLDNAIETVDKKALVKQLKKTRKKVEKLIKRIGPGVVKHCIADSTGFLLKAMALHECGPECGNHDREEGDVA